MASRIVTSGPQKRATFRSSPTVLGSPYIDMGTPMDVNTASFMKRGSLTKKDVLRWKIDSSLLQDNDCNIRSDYFLFSPLPNSKFYLVAFGSSVVNYFSVGLYRVPMNGNAEMEKEINIKVAVSLLDQRDRCHNTCERILQNEVICVTFDRTCYSSQQGWMQFLKNGCLRIHCSLDIEEVLKEEDLDASEKIKEPEAMPEEDLSEDLAGDLLDLFESGLHSDVTICVGDEEFRVHRSVLAARSSVFAAMFDHETLEKNESRIVIEDLNFGALKQLLRFLYTGQITELSSSELLSLFVAADKYSLLKLKTVCSRRLSQQVTSGVALEVLAVANLLKDEGLKQAAIRVVLDNAIDIMKSRDWLVFLREHSEVANSVILNLAMKSLKTSN